MTRAGDLVSLSSADGPRRLGVSRLIEAICGVALLAILLARTLLSETFVVMDVEFLGPSTGLSPAGTARLDLITLMLSMALLLVSAEHRARLGYVIGIALLAGGTLLSSSYAGDPLAARLAGFNPVIALIACATLCGLFQQQHWRRIAIAGIFAVTAAGAYRCISQRHYEFPTTIEAWAEQKKELLARGMRPDDPMLENYERRMRSLEAYGYHYHPNVAGSMLMAGMLICAAGLLAASMTARPSAPAAAGADQKDEALKPSTIDVSSLFALALLGAAAYALKLTGSSGALIAGAVGALALFIGFRYRHALSAHPRRSALLLFAAYFAVILAVATLGMALGTLPGSSLAFRWDYWTAALRAFATAPLTGIGRENFQDAYCMFKSAASVEEVRDPHNLWVTLLVEFGPLGLIGGLTLLATWLSAAFGELSERAAPARPHNTKLGRDSATVAASLDSNSLLARFVGVTLAKATIVVMLAIQAAASGTSLHDANLALLWLFETAGVALCGGALGWALVGSAMRSPAGDALLRIGALAAGGAMLIHALVDYALLTPAGISLFALIAAACRGETATAPALLTNKARMALALIVRIGGVALLVLVWRFAAEPARREFALTRMLNERVLNAAHADDSARALEALAATPGPFGADSYARTLRTALQVHQSAQLSDSGEASIMRAIALMLKRSDANPYDAATWELRAQGLAALANRDPRRPLDVEYATALNDAFDAIRRAVACNPTNPRVCIRAAELTIKLIDPLESTAPRLSAALAVPFVNQCLDEALRIDALRPTEEVMRLRESELKRIEDCRRDMDSISRG
ncbi:MAG: O-antigen ligase family protein [Phycisphaerales bacterium]|nr:O-antigen ligase family protein [Phycisphaerales bacterium]